MCVSVCVSVRRTVSNGIESNLKCGRGGSGPLRSLVWLCCAVRPLRGFPQQRGEVPVGVVHYRNTQPTYIHAHFLNHSLFITPRCLQQPKLREARPERLNGSMFWFHTCLTQEECTRLKGINSVHKILGPHS